MIMIDATVYYNFRDQNKIHFPQNQSLDFTARKPIYCFYWREKWPNFCALNYLFTQCEGDLKFFE